MNKNNEQELVELRKLAEAATKGPWMRLFGERTVYDKMEDGCRGNAIVRADLSYSSIDSANLDFIAAANPVVVIGLLDALAAAPPPPVAPAHALTDAARLDWLDQQRVAYGFEGIQEGNEWIMNGPFATIRHAIDACIQVEAEAAHLDRKG